MGEHTMDLSMQEKQTLFSEMLDDLSDCAGEPFVLFDFNTGMAQLSASLLRTNILFELDSNQISLADWRRQVDPRDLSRLKKAVDDLRSGRTKEYNLNYRVRDRLGQSRWVNSRGRVFSDPDGRPLFAMGRLSAIEAIGRQLEPFSNLAFRREVREILDGLQPGFLLLVGVDDLKTINLQNGRDFGDALLKDIPRVLRDEAGDRAVYRINGDWFAVNLPSFSREQAEAVFEGLRERMEGQCSLSGGCVAYRDYPATDAATLLLYAESSLDYSKAHGKGVLSFFSAADYEARLRELELREDLQASVNEGFAGFSLQFQAQLRTETYALYGAEALLRYASPRRGEVSPGEFMPLLEQSGLIYPVGLWVIREALRFCREWRRSAPDFHISINMSYSQLTQASIGDDVLEILQKSGLPGEALTIEVTESMELLNYPHLNEVFRRWKKVGIGISVDDFGTGYSSLSRLKEMEIDEIKIDRCFVNGIDKSAYNYRLLRNIVELADSCQIRVCCEGVETQDELAVLEELHPTLLQGFLFSKPCSSEQFAAAFVAKPPAPRAPHAHRAPLPPAPLDTSLEEVAKTILNAENDIFYLSDPTTYELYYLNPAGQKMFGVKDYRGRKCYQVLHGQDTPCGFCTNAYLRKDSFYVWENEHEYCGRHFLLKDRLVQYRGRPVRLEVALDITKQEYVSEAAKERLAFASRIAGYTDTLSSRFSFEDAVNQALASVGDFYQADRAYLFERCPEEEGCWANTFEWCADRVESQKGNLQKVAPEAIRRWMEAFDRDETIVLLNLAPLQQTSPLEWEALHSQGIQRLLAVPIREGGVTVAFIGVDNPRYCIRDDAQIRVLASFLLARMRQDRNERRYQALLQSSNQDLMNALNVGFWTFTFHKQGDRREMTANETAEQLLGMQALTDPAERYRFWASRIPAEARAKVNEAVQEMVRSRRIVQVEYPWEHPVDGRITLRFSGLLMQDGPDLIRLKGCSRIVDTP